MAHLFSHKSNGRNWCFFNCFITANEISFGFVMLVGQKYTDQSRKEQIVAVQQITERKQASLSIRLWLSRFSDTLRGSSRNKRNPVKNGELGLYCWWKDVRNKAGVNGPCNNPMSVGLTEAAGESSGNTSRKPSLQPPLSTRASTKVLQWKKCVTFFTWSTLFRCRWGWAFAVWEKEREKEGRTPERSLVGRVRNQQGRAAFQQLFPVFISLFQPLAFCWDVRGGKCVCVCISCGGVLDMTALVSSQLIKFTFLHAGRIHVKLIVWASHSQAERLIGRRVKRMQILWRNGFEWNEWKKRKFLQSFNLGYVCRLNLLVVF